MKEFKSRKECYKILGLNEDSTIEEIKKAYLKMAKKYHPDLNKEDPEANRKFIEVKDAYERLCSPEREQIIIRKYPSNHYRTYRESFYSFRENFFDEINRVFFRENDPYYDIFEYFDYIFEKLMRKFFDDFWEF
ncbi:MAG: DnaJ domain-containing protein [Promethearchaeota archaeon]